MSGIWHREALIIARLREQVPADLPIETTFNQIDFAQADAPLAAGHVQFGGLVPAGQVARVAGESEHWHVHAYLQPQRADAKAKAAAGRLISAALGLLPGWQWKPTALPAEVAPSLTTGYDGRVARVSVAIYLPVFAPADYQE